MSDIENDDEELAIRDLTDNSILMHRDVHFGGKFDIMIDYYSKGGKGACQEFGLERIQELAAMEEQTQKNLAAVMLTGPEAERVRKAKQTYRSLKELANTNTEKSRHARLIADLIFSEEEDPKQEIDAIVAEKSAIVPALIDLLRSEDFHDTLFPGYGLAPALATRCLGLIGDKRALISLFESIGNSDVLDEEDAIFALKSIGEPAKQFLLKIVRSKPITFDNERAATALIAFRDDPEVSETCLKMLEDKSTWQDPALSSYLILACEGLSNPADQQRLLSLPNLPGFPSMLRQDIDIIIKAWKESKS